MVSTNCKEADGVGLQGTRNAGAVLVAEENFV